MIEHLKSMAVFAEVVRAGQFRAAADRLNMTPSAISYHIRVLEEAVGVPLLYRSTRRFTLTTDGAALFDASEKMLAAARAGFAGVQGAAGALSGRLKVTLTTALSHSRVSELIAAFAAECPKVDLHLHYDNRVSDLVAETIDVAVRIGRLDDSSLMCKHIWDMPRTLVASPAFVTRHGPIETPQDLGRVPWIKFAGMEARRVLHGPEGDGLTVEQAGHLTVNSIEAMVDMTRLGVGMSSPPTHFVEGQLKSGALVECLPAYRMATLPVFAIWHRTTVPNPIAQAFVEVLSRKAA
ncbi:LysR family transcriptional regulator [Oceanibium sediminis]|uniref:LysR family transcriptional regulator n=1 Tax=Oceanibium sediminis TaxID=2026339 RepID=UPI000DD49925|nr:LysR family transcriptional regulator [Oceanibium sediminis]